MILPVLAFMSWQEQKHRRFAMAIKTKIWLDDVRPVPDSTWMLFTCAFELNDYLAKGGIDLVDVISLDHDLGDDEKFGTGYHVVEYIEECVHMHEDYPIPELRIHSANPVGIRKMQMGIDSINRYLERK